MLRPTDTGLAGSRRLVAGVALGGLAISQAIVGCWALVAPRSFYAGFPATGHAWVSLLPAYNEHLVRDVGALSLALTVLLSAAALLPTRPLVRVAGAAFAVYTIPHTVFHGLHLEGFPSADAVAQMAGFGVQLLAATAAVLSTLGQAPAPDDVAPAAALTPRP
jgi:hypothetical protein